MVIAASAGPVLRLQVSKKPCMKKATSEVELAIRRILLIHGIILTIGGIPLIYLGDEIGTLNDYTYRDDPAHERDSRWVHRPRTDWGKYAKRNDPNSIEGRVYQGLQKLLVLRKEHDAFSGGELEIIPTDNEHVLGFMRTHAGKRVVIIANFSEEPQVIYPRIFKQYSVYSKQQLHGFSKVSPQSEITIEPLDFLVFG